MGAASSSAVQPREELQQLVEAHVEWRLPFLQACYLRFRSHCAPGMFLIAPPFVQEMLRVGKREAALLVRVLGDESASKLNGSLLLLTLLLLVGKRLQLEVALRYAFELYDLNSSRALTLDELTILLFSISRAVAAISRSDRAEDAMDVAQAEELAQAAFASASLHRSSALRWLPFMRWAEQYSRQLPAIASLLSHRYRVGQMVEWSPEDGTAYYPGRVWSRRADGSLAIMLLDGRLISRAPASSCRLLTRRLDGRQVEERPLRFELSEFVSARSSQDAAHFPGTVTAVHGDGTYDVLLMDGRQLLQLAATSLRRKERPTAAITPRRASRRSLFHSPEASRGDKSEADEERQSREGAEAAGRRDDDGSREKKKKAGEEGETAAVHAAPPSALEESEDDSATVRHLQFAEFAEGASDGERDADSDGGSIAFSESLLFARGSDDDSSDDALLGGTPDLMGLSLTGFAIGRSHSHADMTASVAAAAAAVEVTTADADDARSRGGRGGKQQPLPAWMLRGRVQRRQPRRQLRRGPFASSRPRVGHPVWYRSYPGFIVAMTHCGKLAQLLLADGCPAVASVDDLIVDSRLFLPPAGSSSSSSSSRGSSKHEAAGVKPFAVGDRLMCRHGSLTAWLPCQLLRLHRNGCFSVRTADALWLSVPACSLRAAEGEAEETALRAADSHARADRSALPLGPPVKRIAAHLFVSYFDGRVTYKRGE
eukprot:PLAT3299.3.p1 GENE.PLAT3299.3~~PLAT3299.3.p1  ORF type:complete len:714 (-),score=298.41 PLAT3299.3:18-2159(-)